MLVNLQGMKNRFLVVKNAKRAENQTLLVFSSSRKAVKVEEIKKICG